jgi:tetratricopeptide (TPR) repeat protein
MRHLLFILLFVSLKSNAQTTLKFDKRFVQSEDKWVAFQPDKEGAYAYGFIYIDSQAGLTLNYEGKFKIGATGEFLPTKIDTASVKIRLQANNVLVAHIPENKFKELKIATIPDWLRFYKTDTSSVERLYRWGYMYNGWNECAKALTYLERAEKINPKHKGLAVELSYSYNCLNQYDKAEIILEPEIKTNAEDAYVNKEYIYTLTKSGKINKAINKFDASIKTLKDSQYNAENCYNILQYFYMERDKDRFNDWYNRLQKLPIENKMITQYAQKMKEDMNR